ncbi:MAG: DNA-binding protein [Actinomycetota bacterium]
MRLRLTFCAIIILLLVTSTAMAASIPSTELIENSRKFDGRKVIYRGEVVGDVMIRGNHAWINVYDGKNALGIWCSADLARKIRYKGEYRYLGDTILIEGIFHRACPEHGGDMDIHAIKVDVIKSGHTVAHPFNIRRAFIALVLLMISGGLFVINRLKVRKLQGSG